MLCTGCLLVLLLFGCKPSTPPPASEPPALTTGQVQRVYDLYLSAQYPAYVAEMASWPKWLLVTACRMPIADKWPTCFARMPIARH